jgi:exodeoxyribonuclease VII large subunit
VIAGGPDYYRGSAQSSPAFYFRATHIRLAGEGDLLARLEALRKQLETEGLFELQKQLARPVLPRTIGVVTAEAGAARRDLLAGLERRGWHGTVVWAFAPVQDRHAAPAIAAAIQGLAAQPQVETIVVARGGGSLADLWAFCDETLCRTVAMLRVPVISAVGHERDSTLIDDVAAVDCSTPTHAAEAAVPLDCLAAREALERCAGSLRRAAGVAVQARTPHLVALARGPARALRREQLALNQKTREIRAASERGIAERIGFQRRLASVVLERARQRAAGAEMQRRREALHRAQVALRAHEPERTLERGYALVEAGEGEPVTSAASAVAAERVRLRFADGSVGATVEEDG